MTTSKTYTQYTKEKLQSYIKSPLANIDNLRDISAFLYRISHNYKKIIEYYAYTPIFSYNVSYNTPDWANPPQDASEYIKGYQELCTRLDKMDLKEMGSQIIATCLRDGIYCGFCYDDGDSFFIHPLDPKYYKIGSRAEKDTWIVKFDASYFDSGNNKDFLYGTGSETDSEEGLWDDVFVEGYETYKSKGNDYKWFELPPEKTICIICGDDPVSIYDVINVVKEGINTVRELDTAMVEVEKVSDETEQSYANFRKTVSETATEIASTNKELLNSSADFLRLGYDINQASDLAKNATLFVNVGDGVDINEATEDMITAMKAFDIQAKDSIKIVDDYNQIGNLYALSATDIGEAMKRSASALETGNNTFEERKIKTVISIYGVNVVNIIGF